MRTKRSRTTASYSPNRQKCRACKGHRDHVGPLSRRGLCESCGIAHQVAQWMGLNWVEYYDETVNQGVRLNYSGPVIKAA